MFCDALAGDAGISAVEVIMSRLRTLIRYLQPHQRQVWLGIGALLLVNAIGVFLPWFIKIAIDEFSDVVRTGSDLLGVRDRLLVYVLIVLATSTLMGAVRIASRVWMFGAGRLVEFDLKRQIFGHLLILPPSYFQSQSAGDIISRATSDVENLRRLVGFAVLSLINTFFAYLLTLPAMLLIDVRLTLIALSVYPVMLVLVQVSSDRLRLEQATVQDRLSEVSELIQEDMNGIGLIKVYAQEQNEQRAFGQRNRHLLDANLALARTRNILFPALVALAGTGILVLLVIGGPQIARGEISLGELSALTLYVERLVFPTALLGFTITAYQRGQVSIDRLNTILQTTPAIANVPGAVALESVRGEIRAQGLSFRYAGALEPALQDLGFTVAAGTTVAIVGPIGSGKSTLANAFPRLLDIAPGQLYLDGVDLTQVQLRCLRRAIAYVPQDSFLFGMSVRDNIRYGRPDASEAEVIEAAKAAYIHAEILNFPQQYDTLVGERGITLSGGQRQRVALARALLMDASVLVLDDALSSVDNQTGQAILDQLRRYRKTVVFISHRMTAAADADQILVMDTGRIIQTGTHQSLLRDREGLYARLWQQHEWESVLA